MPQIYMMMNRMAEGPLLSGHRLPDLGRILTRAVEKDFGLEGLNGVAFSVPQLLIYTSGEKDVQLEVRYTAGEDEYDWGRPFDPSPEEQRLLCAHLKEALLEFLAANSLPPLSVSVWCKPHYHGTFMAWD